MAIPAVHTPVQLDLYSSQWFLTAHRHGQVKAAGQALSTHTPVQLYTSTHAHIWLYPLFSHFYETNTRKCKWIPWGGSPEVWAPSSVFSKGYPQKQGTTCIFVMWAGLKKAASYQPYWAACYQAGSNQAELQTGWLNSALFSLMGLGPVWVTFCKAILNASRVTKSIN